MRYSTENILNWQNLLKQLTKYTNHENHIFYLATLYIVTWA